MARHFIPEADEAHELLSGIIAHAKHKGSPDPVATAASAVGISRWSAWTIFKRRKKAIAGSVLAAIRREYLRICVSQLSRLEAQVSELKKRCGDDDDTFIDLGSAVARLAERVRQARQRQRP